MDTYFVPLTERQLERVKKELNVSDGMKFEHSVRLLEEWVSYQTYLPQNYDRALLRSFLGQAKLDLEKAKSKLRSYFINISKLPQLFENRMLSLEPEYAIFRYMHSYPLPEMTPEGYRITFSKILNPDPNAIDMRRVIQMITLCADYRMHIQDISAGDVFVMDAELLHGGHMPVFLNTTVKKCVEFSLESYPLRIKSIHIIANTPIVIHGINIFKAFLSEDLRNKIYVHKNLQSLLQYVPLRCLPAEYGGGQKSLGELSVEVTKMLRRRKDIFENVESLKIVGPVPKDVDMTSTLEFGVQGSFRQLNVD